VLWNLTLALPAAELADVSQPHIEFLDREWQPSKGVSYAAGIETKDADDSAITLDVLRKFGITKDAEALFSFEEPNHFRCFDLEADPSISNNIHVMSALRHFGFDYAHPTIQKIARFLEGNRKPEGYWIDKWHLSPYYPTCHAIIGCAGYASSFVADAVAWVIGHQHESGGWGYYKAPTPEETAYCLQALAIWNQTGGSVDKAILARGRDWLTEHQHDPTPSLWIGKCLYCPEYVIQSAILSALVLAEA